MKLHPVMCYHILIRDTQKNPFLRNLTYQMSACIYAHCRSGSVQGTTEIQLTIERKMLVGKGQGFVPIRVPLLSATWKMCSYESFSSSRSIQCHSSNDRLSAHQPRSPFYFSPFQSSIRSNSPRSARA